MHRVRRQGEGARPLAPLYQDFRFCSHLQRRGNGGLRPRLRRRDEALPSPLNPQDLLRRHQQDLQGPPSPSQPASLRGADVTDLEDPLLWLLQASRLCSPPRRRISGGICRDHSRRSLRSTCRAIGPCDSRRRPQVPHWALPQPWRQHRPAQVRPWRCHHRQHLPSRSSLHRCHRRRSSPRQPLAAQHHLCPRRLRRPHDRRDGLQLRLDDDGTLQFRPAKILSARLPPDFLQNRTQLLAALQRGVCAPKCHLSAPHALVLTVHLNPLAASGLSFQTAGPGLKLQLHSPPKCVLSLSLSSCSDPRHAVRVCCASALSGLPVSPSWNTLQLADALHYLQAGLVQVWTPGGSPPTVAYSQVCARLLPNNRRHSEQRSGTTVAAPHSLACSYPQPLASPDSTLHPVSTNSVQTRISGGSPPTATCPQVCATLLPDDCLRPGLSCGTVAVQLQCRASPPPLSSARAVSDLPLQEVSRGQGQLNSPRSTLHWNGCISDNTHHKHTISMPSRLQIITICLTTSLSPQQHSSWPPVAIMVREKTERDYLREAARPDKRTRELLRRQREAQGAKGSSGRKGSHKGLKASAKVSPVRGEKEASAALPHRLLHLLELPEGNALVHP